MKIGEIALHAQCTVETVRYYEKEGLLPAPARTATNYRSYGSSHVERLHFIRNCRAMNMTLEEIRTLLGLMAQPAGDCGGVNQLLDEHIAHVDVRIADLSQLKQQLSELRQCCQREQAVDACGILQGLASMETEPRREWHTHLG
ncbi:MAG: Cd(II)/Pb(II)-responsive transcriptional regulator [Nitrospirae bacterium]|jgi:Cd(II)/Pb(II)-responsive transcriptional regulator|nr:Cd(II)/Pb(II)-responsive transcriptional regulator [Nitrospirota bacterium]